MYQSTTTRQTSHGPRRTGVIATAAAALLALSVFADPALADSNVDPNLLEREDLVSRLGSRYSEAPVAMGLTEQGQLIEVLSTDDGATWTIILTAPDGTSRIVGSGNAWIPVAASAGPRA